MPTKRSCVLAVAVAVALIPARPGAAAAQGPPARPVAPAAESPVLAAIAMTRERGVPVVMIVTSRQNPASVLFGREFLASTWARRQRGLVQFVEVNAEENPQFVAALKVAQYPTAVLLRRGEAGLTRDQTSQDCRDVASLSAWLSPMVEIPTAAAKSPTIVDRDVAQASHWGQSSASPQGYPTANLPASAPPAPQFTQAMPTMASVPQMAAAPPMASAMANVISVPSQSFVIQQQAPQVFMAPAQAPVIYVPQQGSGLASAPAATPASNMFLPIGNAGLASAPASAPAAMMVAAQPSMGVASPAAVGVAAQPAFAFAAPAAVNVAAAPAAVGVVAPAAVGFAAQPAVAVAAPAAVGLAAVTNQQLNLPTSSSRTRVRVRGPGPLASAASRFGERLTQLGRARIVTEQETTLAAPLSQAASPGMTTISSTSAVPLASAPPQQPVMPPVIAVPPAGAPPSPPTLRPSPQGEYPSHHDR